MQSSKLRALIELIDTLIFLLLAGKGLVFVAIGGGGYIIFWGCALICTAVYWKSLDKKPAVDSFSNFFLSFKRRS